MSYSKLKKVGRKFLAFFISSAVLILFLESALRLSRAISDGGGNPHLGAKPSAADLGDRSTKPMRDSSAGAKPFRIVAIGESTTAPWSDGAGPDSSWPALLEDALQVEFEKLNLDFNVEVINRGRSAASSGFLVQAFKKDFSALKPDLVITMLGINDAHLFSIQQSVLFRYSYLFRFVYWSLKYADCSQCFRNSIEGVSFSGTESARPFTERERKLLEMARHRLKARKSAVDGDGELSEFVESLIQGESLITKSVVRLHFGVDLSEFLLSSGQSPVGVGRDTKTALLFEFAAKLFEQSLPIVGVEYHYGFEYFCHIQQKLKKSCMDVALAGFRDGLRPNAALVTLLSYDLKSNDPEFSSILESIGWELRPTRVPLELTRESYMELAKILRSSRDQNRKPVPWIVMQYPTGSIDGLKGLFFEDWRSRMPGATRLSDLFQFKLREDLPPLPFEEIFFVSNENFIEKNAAQKNPNLYFRDYFGRASGLNFGHTTAAGSQLIVDNILEQMRPHWKAIADH